MSVMFLLFNRKIILILSTLFLFNLLLSEQVYAEADVLDNPYYPQCRQTKLRVTEEDYQDLKLSLKNITGVYVVLDYVLGAVESNGLQIREDLEEEVKRRLNEAGLDYLTKEQHELTLGQPRFDIFATVPEHILNEDGSRHIENYACCTASIWSSFSQGATLLNEPLSNYKLSTWGEGGDTGDCSDIGGWLYNIVLEKIDNFVADYLKAKEHVAEIKNAMENPEPLAEKEAVPECNTSIILFAELFKSGSHDISIPQLPVMTQLASIMKNCANYRYLLETHADQRGSDAYNDELTQKRALSIKGYLMANGVDEKRFEVVSHGKRKLVTTGQSEQDYITNRRVVVVPFKVF